MRIMLVEDHPVVREALQDFISRLPQVTVCEAESDAESALKALDKASPDLLLIDLSLPGMNGIELVRKIRERQPGLECMILSGHSSRAYVREALAAGANGYLLKGDPLEIERGILAITRGERYISNVLDESIH